MTVTSSLNSYTWIQQHLLDCDFVEVVEQSCETFCDVTLTWWLDMEINPLMQKKKEGKKWTNSKNKHASKLLYNLDFTEAYLKKQ